MNITPVSRERFPIARRVLRLARRARLNWLQRHQTRFSFGIHMIGIPLAFSGLGLLFVLRYEGNDVGELIPIKRLLGMPVVAIAPQFQNPG
jgi:hypothetical protein